MGAGRAEPGSVGALLVVDDAGRAVAAGAAAAHGQSPVPAQSAVGLVPSGQTHAPSWQTRVDRTCPVAQPLMQSCFGSPGHAGRASPVDRRRRRESHREVCLHTRGAKAAADNRGQSAGDSPRPPRYKSHAAREGRHERDQCLARPRHSCRTLRRKFAGLLSAGRGRGGRRQRLLLSAAHLGQIVEEYLDRLPQRDPARDRDALREQVVQGKRHRVGGF